MTTVFFPSILVLARADRTAGKVIGFVDCLQLNNEGELNRRLATYANLEAAGAVPYARRLSAVDQAAEALAELVAELEYQEGWRADPTVTPLDQAAELARQRWAGDRLMLGRVERALELVRAGKVRQVDADHWEVIGSKAGQVYTLNGRGCECMDYEAGHLWCKHRIAVALVKRAAELKNGAGSAVNTPAPELAPEGTNLQEKDTTDPRPSQVELVVAYETDQARALPRMGAAELVTFTADGLPTDPPTRDLDALYRWLQERGYTPAGFEWQGRALAGKRQRRQVYALAGA